ncbi:MAG TPA: hypothetical protein VIM25_11120 [Candidatus Limnocylindrales bacterium]
MLAGDPFHRGIPPSGRFAAEHLDALFERKSAFEQRPGDLEHSFIVEGHREALLLVNDLVEPARVKALHEMGEGRRAMSVAMSWLERKSG